MSASQDLSEAIKAMRDPFKTMPHDGWYWSEKDIYNLKSMFSEGVGVSQIAVELLRSERAVSQEIEKLDLYERKEHPRRHHRTRACKGFLCLYCNGDCDNCPIANSNDSTQEALNV